MRVQMVPQPEGQRRKLSICCNNKWITSLQRCSCVSQTKGAESHEAHQGELKCAYDGPFAGRNQYPLETIDRCACNENVVPKCALRTAKERRSPAWKPKKKKHARSRMPNPQPERQRRKNTTSSNLNHAMQRRESFTILHLTKLPRTLEPRLN